MAAVGDIMAIDASIIVVSHNRKAILEQCLKCLAAQQYPSDRFEIILVDDGSTDGTAAMTDTIAFPCAFRCLTLDERRGPGPARNAGIAVGRGEIIIFIDSDVFVAPWFLHEHVATHRAHQRAIVDGPVINISEEAHLEHPPFNAPSIRLLATLGFFGEPFITANTSVSRVDLLAVGGFDEAFGTRYGWEDVELGLRLRLAGLTVVRNRRAYGLHYKAGKPTLAERARQRRELAVNAVIYYRKNPTRQVLRDIRYHYLVYDRVFTRLGWTRRFLTPEYLAMQPSSPWRSFLNRCFLIHVYAEGLKDGFAQHYPCIRVDY